LCIPPLRSSIWPLRRVGSQLGYGKHRCEYSEGNMALSWMTTDVVYSECKIRIPPTCRFCDEVLRWRQARIHARPFARSRCIQLVGSRCTFRTGKIRFVLLIVNVLTHGRWLNIGISILPSMRNIFSNFPRYYTGDDRYVNATKQALLFQAGPENNYQPENQTRTEVCGMIAVAVKSCVS
jgi:hypothetical protein